MAIDPQNFIAASERIEHLCQLPNALRLIVEAPELEADTPRSALFLVNKLRTLIDATKQPLELFSPMLVDALTARGFGNAYANQKPFLSWHHAGLAYGEIYHNSVGERLWFHSMNQPPAERPPDIPADAIFGFLWPDALSHIREFQYWDHDEIAAGIARERIVFSSHCKLIGVPSSARRVGFLGPRELAKGRVPEERFAAFKKALEGWRKNNPSEQGNAWQSVETEGRNAERFQYRVESEAVEQIIGEYSA